MDVVITTICSTFTGTANTALASAFNRLLDVGSSLSSTLAEAQAGVTLYPSILSSYDGALRSYVVPLYNAASMNDADAANVVAMNAQLVQVLEALVATSATRFSPSSVAGYLYDYQAIYSYTNTGVNRKLAMLSCNAQNSINSIGSEVSSEFEVVRQQAWVRAYFSARPPTVTVASVSCSQGCVTSTIEATSTATTADTPTGTEMVTSSRTVSGSVQRCLVRPTLTSDSTTATPEAS